MTRALALLASIALLSACDASKPSAVPTLPQTPEQQEIERKGREARKEAARVTLAGLASSTDENAGDDLVRGQVTKKNHSGNLARFYFARFDRTAKLGEDQPIRTTPVRGSLRGSGLDLRAIPDLQIDGKLHHLWSASKDQPSACSWNRHVFRGGDVWESCDVPLSKLDAELMRALASAKDVKVRFVGERERDWIIPKGQLACMKRVYAAWDANHEGSEETAMPFDESLGGHSSYAIRVVLRWNRWKNTASNPWASSCRPGGGSFTRPDAELVSATTSR